MVVFLKYVDIGNNYEYQRFYSNTLY
jgi:hypothetical protein